MEVTQILIVFGIIIISMTLHEMAHGYMAYFLGDNTAKIEGRLSLNPFNHLDPWLSVILPLLLYIAKMPVFGGAKPVPIDARNLKGGVWGMALVGVAGPLMNFILALVAFLVGSALGVFTVRNGGLYYGDLWGFAVLEMVMVNLGFMVFNLLPIPPLDGSRVLYAIAPDGAREVMERMERSVGLVVVFVLVMVFGTALSKITSTAIDGVLDFFCMLVGK